MRVWAIIGVVGMIGVLWAAGAWTLFRLNDDMTSVQIETETERMAECLAAGGGCGCTGQAARVVRAVDSWAARGGREGFVEVNADVARDARRSAVEFMDICRPGGGGR